jgi:hypothetical protein
LSDPVYLDDCTLFDILDAVDHLKAIWEALPPDRTESLRPRFEALMRVNGWSAVAIGTIDALSNFCRQQKDLPHQPVWALALRAVLASKRRPATEGGGG